MLCAILITSVGIFSDLYETHIEQAVYILWESHVFQVFRNNQFPSDEN